MTANLPADQVLRRMKSGDFPSKGSHSMTATFSDGKKATHQTMRKLTEAGEIVATATSFELAGAEPPPPRSGTRLRPVEQLPHRPPVQSAHLPAIVAKHETEIAELKRVVASLLDVQEHGPLSRTCRECGLSETRIPGTNVYHCDNCADA